MIELKKEYTILLCHILTPVILEGLQHLYNESKKNSNKNNILKTFQLLLKSIPTWDVDIIKKEVDRIIMKTKEQSWLVQLVQLIFKLNILVNNLEPTEVMKKEIDFGLFVHSIYIECARQFWMDPFFFYHEYSSLEQKKNYCEIMKIIGQCIENAIRRLLPIRAILNKFLGEGVFNNKELELLDSYNIPLILDMEILPSYDTKLNEIGDFDKQIGNGIDNKQIGGADDNQYSQDNQIQMPSMMQGQMASVPAQIMQGQMASVPAQIMQGQMNSVPNQIMQGQMNSVPNQIMQGQMQQPISAQMMQGQMTSVPNQIMQGQMQQQMMPSMISMPGMAPSMMQNNQIGGMDTNENNINEKILNIINKNSLLTDSNDNNNFTVNNHSANDNKYQGQMIQPQIVPMMQSQMMQPQMMQPQMMQPQMMQPQMMQPQMMQPQMMQPQMMQNRHHSDRKTSSTLKRIIQESIRQNNNTATKSNDSHNNSDIKNKILKDLDSDTANYNPEENANNYQDVFSNSEMKQTINTNEKVEKKSREKFFNNYLNI